MASSSACNYVIGLVSVGTYVGTQIFTECVVGDFRDFYSLDLAIGMFSFLLSVFLSGGFLSVCLSACLSFFLAPQWNALIINHHAPTVKC